MSSEEQPAVDAAEQIAAAQFNPDASIMALFGRDGEEGAKEDGGTTPSDATNDGTNVGGYLSLAQRSRAQSPTLRHTPPRPSRTIAGGKNMAIAKAVYDAIDSSSEDEEGDDGALKWMETDDDDNSNTCGEKQPAQRGKRAHVASAKTAKRAKLDTAGQGTSTASATALVIKEEPISAALIAPDVSVINAAYLKTGKRARKFPVLEHYKAGDRLIDLAVIGTVLNYDPPSVEARKSKSSRLSLRLDDGVVLNITADRRNTSELLMRYAAVTARVEMQKLVCAKTPKEWTFIEESAAFFHPQKKTFCPPRFDTQGRLRRIKHLAFFSDAPLQLLTPFVKFEASPAASAASASRYGGGAAAHAATTGRAAARDEANNRCTIMVRWVHGAFDSYTAGANIVIALGSVRVRNKQVEINTIPAHISTTDREFGAIKLEAGYDWHRLDTGRA